MKVLPTNRLVEMQRDQIVTSFADSGTENMNKAFNMAIGGTLFIDEAYRLAGDTEGNKAIDTLMRRMHEDCGKLCVIMAGYKNGMEKFIRVNEGMESRINHILVLEDYTVEELSDIFCLVASKQKNPYKFANGAKRALQDKIEEMLEEKNENWGNAREMNKLFNVVTKRVADRLMKMQMAGTLTREDFFTFVSEDFEF